MEPKLDKVCVFDVTEVLVKIVISKKNHQVLSVMLSVLLCFFREITIRYFILLVRKIGLWRLTLAQSAVGTNYEL